MYQISRETNDIFQLKERLFGEHGINSDVQESI